MRPDAPRLHPNEVGIPVRDAVELAADVHLPDAPLPAPAVVIGTPYGKEREHAEVVPLRDAGYVVVVYDCRGRGKSEGAWRAFVHDPEDGHDVVEWAARQPWCDGAVGATGLSYSGWIVWATASQRPVHLQAAVSTSPAGRWMQEIPYTNGCFQLYFAYWLAATRRRIPERPTGLSALVGLLPVDEIGRRIAPAGRSWADMMEQDRSNPFWDALRWDGDYGDFDLPCLHVTGWHDREDIDGAFHHYEQMLASSPAADRQWLVVGPWSHGGCRAPRAAYDGVAYPGAAIDVDALHVRFFDRFLRERDSGFDREPRVRLYDPGAKAWRAPAAWRGGTTVVRRPLDHDGRLADESGPPGTCAYAYDPESPTGLRFDVDVLPWEPPIDLASLEAQDGTASWTGEPLAEPLTIHGRGSLELYAATDGADTDWHVKLADVGPDGRALCVAWGCLRASYGANPRRPAPVTPGAVRRYEIELTPTFHTVAAGHRLRLVVASSDWPWFARNLNRFGPIARQADPRVAVNTIHFGADRPSALLLPATFPTTLGAPYARPDLG